MKNIIIVFGCMLAALSGAAQFTKATLQASGLTCSMCNNAISKALKELPFIATVKADIKTASFDISFKPSTDADIDAIRKAVEDAGFFVAKLKVTGVFDHVAVKNDEHVVIDGKTYHFLEVSDQVLNGEQTLTLLDKNFLTAREFKKLSHATKMACLQTGKDQNSRIYHVTI